MQARVLLLPVLFLLTCAPQVQACAVCFGLRESHLNNAVNMAIFVMFGCLILVLGSLAAFVVCLARRAARNPLQIPESVDGTAHLNSLNEV